MRLPRATPLPPVPGLAPVDTTGRHRHSEMLVDSLRAQRSLEPERRVPLMTSRRAPLYPGQLHLAGECLGGANRVLYVGR